MGAFGDQLKQARQTRGITLDAVARATHIARHYLDALEKSDLAALPGGPFNTGYIRTYAQHLGIDPLPVLEAYRREARVRGLDAHEREKQMLQELHRLLDEKAKRRRRSRFSPISPFSSGVARRALAGVLLGLVLASGWYLIRRTADRRATEGIVVAELSTPAEAGSPVAARPAQKQGVQTTVTQSLPSAADSATAKPSSGLPPADEGANPWLTVPDFRVGTSVVERQLLGDSDRFPEGTRVWFWTLVVGGQPGDVVRHVWTYEGRRVARSELRVDGAWWRTYSRLTLPVGSVGSWAVEARDADGRVLARKEFLCLPSSR